MKTTIEIKMNGKKEATFTFPQFNATCTIHQGRHINSTNGWRRFLPHGNTKQVVVREVVANIYISKMINMPETATDKYRLDVNGNFGARGYVSTGEMNITKEMFEALTVGLEKRHSKANRNLYVID